MKAMPYIKVSGSYSECGKQIGIQYKELIEKYLEVCRSEPPESLSWQQCIERSKEYLLPTTSILPEIISVLHGVAEGAGVSFIELFTSTIEEYYAKQYATKNCTDIIVIPPAGEHTLVAHNNDLSLSVHDTIASVEWNIDNGLKLYTIGLAGFLTSVGVNNRGIVLSGNELTPTDTRASGVPRSLIACAILYMQSFEDAVKIATLSQRASSYNNIITISGKSVSIEGSATDYELIYPSNGVLTHSNHYCSTKMLPYEGKTENAMVSSVKRLNAANSIISAEKPQYTIDKLKRVLKDHGIDNEPGENSICRHSNTSPSTIFGFIVDLDEQFVEVAYGNPCQNDFQLVWKY